MNTGEAMALLEKHADKKIADGMDRFGISTQRRVLGMTVGTMRSLAKQIGRDHDLALKLWDTGVYEAQFVACFIADPAKLTVKQMDAWTKSFDNWATCDTACFCLFDRSPLAWGRIEPWAKSKEEFVKRAGYALIASLAGHDKDATDDDFYELLPLIEKGASDERNFVWKGVSWALRRTGLRSPELMRTCTAIAKQLAASDNKAKRWVGKDALNDFAKARARTTNKATSPARKLRASRAGDRKPAR